MKDGMSTKSSIILTSQNEHWYMDSSEPLEDQNGERKDAITLEFSKENIRIDTNDNEDLIITITNPDSQIYELFESMWMQRFNKK